jgi:hypothetical protein
MARVVYARLGSRIKRNEQTGSYSLMGSFTALSLINTPVSFVLIVYWPATDETFPQSFAITDGQGNLLDQTPTTQCVLKSRQINTSTAFFHTVFPRAGQYNINVYQNGICTETIPLAVTEVQEINDDPRSSFAALEGAAPG